MLIHYVEFYNFSVSPGNTYNYIPFNASIATTLYDTLWRTGNCIQQTKDCIRTNNEETCSAAVNGCLPVHNVPFSRSLHDIREPLPDPFPSQYFVDYLNTP